MYNKGIIGDIWWATLGNRIPPNERAVEDTYNEALEAFAAEPENKDRQNALTNAVTKWTECCFENGFTYAVMLMMECLAIYRDKSEAR